MCQVWLPLSSTFQEYKARFSHFIDFLDNFGKFILDFSPMLDCTVCRRKATSFYPNKETISQGGVVVGRSLVRCKPTLRDELAKGQIRFHFNPHSTPHFGE